MGVVAFRQAAVVLAVFSSASGFSSPASLATRSATVRPVEPNNKIHKSAIYPANQASREQRVKKFALSSFSYGRRGTFKGRWEAAEEDFKAGALEVHENYWELFWGIYGRVLLGALCLCGITGVTYSISPEAGINLLEAYCQILFWIEGFITDAFAAVKAAPVYIFVLPFMFLAAIPSKLIGVLPASGLKAVLMRTIGVPVVHTALWIVRLLSTIAQGAEATFVETGGSKILQDATTVNPVFFAFQLLVVAPIVEEIVFRRWLMVGLKNLLKQRPTDYLASLEEQRNDLSPWAVISSIIFASAHVVNWIRPLRWQSLRDYNSQATAMTLVALAVAQFFATLGVSLRVLTPAFEDSGLASSIGAHTMWNFSVLTSFVGLPIRAWNRLIDWVRGKGENDSSWRWLS